MPLAEIAVTLAGLVAIAFLAWFFFGPKQAQAARVKGKVQEIEVTVKGGHSPDIIRVKKGIPVAAGVLYPAIGLLLNPMIAAAAMAMSSLSVVTNANRLRGYKPLSLTVPEVVKAVRPRVEVSEMRKQEEVAMTTVKDPVCGMEIDPIEFSCNPNVLHNFCLRWLGSSGFDPR